MTGLAAYAYARGHDPVDWAEGLIAGLIEVHATVACARADDPGAFPGYAIDPGLAPLARRIIGELLDAGWAMPEPPP